MEKVKEFFRKASQWIGAEGFQLFCVFTIVAFVLCGFLPWWIALIVSLILSLGKEGYDLIVAHIKGEGFKSAMPGALHGVVCALAGILFGLICSAIHTISNI